MPLRRLHHLDLAVANVDESVAFYLALLGPLGLREMVRYPTYRGTEEVVYLGVDAPVLGFRSADGGSHRYYDVGRASTSAASNLAPTCTFRPKRIAMNRATGPCSFSIRTVSG